MLNRFATFGLPMLLAATATVAAQTDAPLADAVAENDRTAVQTLLQKGVDVNAAQVDGMTALHWAVHLDNFQTAKLLVSDGANAKAENRYGVTPLSLACTNGNAAIVELLLEAGADPNTTLRGGETVLMTAARTGKLAPVQALLFHGADVNAKERKGQTALMWAAAEGHVAVVDALLEADAEFRTRLKSGFTPFFFAVREGRSGAVLRLLDAGIGVNEVMRPRFGRAAQARISPLLLAIENGHFELALELFEAGANPNEQRIGYTALHAISWVRKPIRGDGDPPPIGSGSVSSLQLVRHLVTRGADVNARRKRQPTGRARLNMTDTTPFLLASRTADIPLMRLLVELGADPLLPNADGCTPLMAASGVGALGDGDEAAATETEALEAVKLLLELGADVNTRDANGETAMHGAAYKSWPKMVQLLADNGADAAVWNRKNKQGWTPQLIAEGHRPGNFRPSPETLAALKRVIQ